MKILTQADVTRSDIAQADNLKLLILYALHNCDKAFILRRFRDKFDLPTQKNEDQKMAEFFITIMSKDDSFSDTCGAICQPQQTIQQLIHGLGFPSKSTELIFIESNGTCHIIGCSISFHTRCQNAGFCVSNAVQEAADNNLNLQLSIKGPEDLGPKLVRPSQPIKPETQVAKAHR